MTSKEPEEWDSKVVKNAMTISFPFQRQAINVAIPVSKILEDWPILGMKYGLLSHFKLLMDFDVVQIVTETLGTKVERILKYFNMAPPPPPPLLVKVNRACLPYASISY